MTVELATNPPLCLCHPDDRCTHARRASDGGNPSRRQHSETQIHKGTALIWTATTAASTTRTTAPSAAAAKVVFTVGAGYKQRDGECKDPGLHGAVLQRQAEWKALKAEGSEGVGCHMSGTTALPHRRHVALSGSRMDAGRWQPWLTRLHAATKDEESAKH